MDVPQLPEDMWCLIVKNKNTTGKTVQRLAGVSRWFLEQARTHPDTHYMTCYKKQHAAGGCRCGGALTRAPVWVDLTRDGEKSEDGFRCLRFPGPGGSRDVAFVLD